MQSVRLRKWSVGTRLLAVLSVLVMAAMPAGILPAKADSLSDLQKKLAELQERQKQLDKDIKNTSGDLNKQKELVALYDEQIENVEAQIDEYEHQIANLDQQIADKEQQITSMEQEITDREAAIQDRFEKLRLRVRSIAQTGNLSALQMLLNTEEYADYLLKSQVMKQISEHDQALMDELEAEKKEINSRKEQVQQDKDSVLQARESQLALKADMDKQKKSLDSLYKVAKQERDKLQKDLNTYQAEQKRIKADEAKLEKMIQDLLNTTPSDGKYGGSMFWPAPNVKRISSPFGYRWGGDFHGGTDISNGASLGEKIVAAADGTVIKANKTDEWGMSYGYYTMIDHGRDSKGRQIVTLYAHMKKGSPIVNVGDKVVGGQTVIGYIGNTGNSFGAHLHFEVRVNGTRVDPVGNGYISLPK